MKRPVPVESALAIIDEKVRELGDWRRKTLAKVREIIHEADPEIVEGRGRKGCQVPFLLGCSPGPLDAKGGQNFCGHLRAPWNTRRISTALLRTR